jgi:hypothetical protein
MSIHHGPSISMMLQENATLVGWDFCSSFKPLPIKTKFFLNAVLLFLGLWLTLRIYYVIILI